MASKATVLTVAAVVATGVVAYAVYFDHKRRTDADFRKQLRKEKKRVNKSLQQSKLAEEKSTAVDPEELKQALQAIKNEPMPPIEEREQFFMSQIALGEQMAAQGPAFHVPAAIAFFRALRIYPAPTELIGIYQSTVSPPVFKLVIEMTNMDAATHTQGYFDCFPPKSKNVSILPEQSKTMTGVHHVLIVTKDIASGETIYKEFPIVAALDHDLQLAGTHCTHCFREIEDGKAVKCEESAYVLPSAYCSESCLTASKQRSQSLLFTMANPLPDALMVGPLSAEIEEKRKAAQKAFAESVKEHPHRNVPMLLARFVARQVNRETEKLVSTATSFTGTRQAGPGPDQPGDFTESEGNDEQYSLNEHAHRWSFIDVKPEEKDMKLLADLLAATLPGLEQFTTEERHAEMVGKTLYNAFGVCFGNGREDKPVPNVRPEDVEKTRTSFGTQRQVGSALYTLSSHLTHSCEPSARIEYSSGTNELHLVANRPLKKGDVVSVAFVDVTQHSGESAAECRRRRRIELARGWRFACGCERCAEEGKIAESAAAAAAPVAAPSSETAPAETEVPSSAAVTEEKVADSTATVVGDAPEPTPESAPQPQAEDEAVLAPAESTEETQEPVIIITQLETTNSSEYGTPLETPVTPAQGSVDEVVAEATTELEAVAEEDELEKEQLPAVVLPQDEEAVVDEEEDESLVVLQAEEVIPTEEVSDVTVAAPI